MTIPYLGLSGFAGAGKDTVFERLRELDTRFVRLSVADPLKESVAALFGISPDHLEDLKREPDSIVVLGRDGQEDGEVVLPDVLLSMREFLQRYGTEAHREVFGSDFWLDLWERKASALQDAASGMSIHRGPAPLTVVNTSVRFENEARRIIAMGGQVWHVEGPQDDGAAGHESERRLPDSLISHVIDNTVRAPYNGESQAVDGAVYPVLDFSYLDDQLATLLHGGAL
jgi:hypothetical protein